MSSAISRCGADVGGAFCEASQTNRSPRRLTDAHHSSADATLRRIHSDELLGRAQQIEILHRGQAYRLRLTALGKLILTK